MRRTLTSIVAVGLLSGCAPGNPGLIVLNVVAPSDQCTYDVDNPQLLSGSYDLAAGVGYVGAFRFANQLRDLGNSGTSGPPRANPNVIQLEEFEVELRDTAGAAIGVGGLPNPYTVPAGGGVIPSSDGTSPGEGISSAVLIPPVYVPELAPFAGSTIVVAVRGIGTTAGGAELITDEFNYPIALCAGCLNACMMEDGRPVCRLSCTPGQDEISYIPAACGSSEPCTSRDG